MPRSRGGVDFCCFALPLVNFGAYAILLENAFVALCIIVLAAGTPSIVALMGGATPAGLAKILLLVLALVVLLWQLFGVVAVRRQSTRTYRLYLRINTILTLAIIGVSAAFLAIGAARHSTAVEACVANFGSVGTTTSTSAISNTLSSTANSVADTGNTICNAFVWVQVGAMAGLIVLLGLTQLYMLFCQRAYGQKQRAAASDLKIESGPGDDIPLSHRDSTTWDPYSANTADGTPVRYSESHDYVAPAQAGAMYASPYDAHGQAHGYGAPYQQPTYDVYEAPGAGAAAAQPYAAAPPGGPNRRSHYDGYGY
ncbi:hypothetical protein OC834_006219 [Tilletia horrida]|uniref:Uncharacterized protein n=1 Tax=Tilletia horrida TaxID=155126 RepID=A0AAN6JMG3_9BASI|nr:hypothetical protein OC834_006219 [Tilletia horrida]KAK0533424.1 hypothetical protein OC835_003026 [Tilletia horrida]KAK0535425.1 hypothetical protein OC842_002319 [Tilletia horrida]KAK0557034.1 hypothetical protein OC844_005676 [Tilletia horrida]